MVRAGELKSLTIFEPECYKNNTEQCCIEEKYY
jgi:hypothetical protein